MRASDPPVRYLVGTPKGRLSQLEEKLTPLPWQNARAGVDVKLLPEEGDLYVLAHPTKLTTGSEIRRFACLARIFHRRESEW